MIRLQSFRPLLLTAFLAVCFESTRADDVPAAAPKIAAPKAPRIAPASDDANRALQGFKVPTGFNVTLFAAEPLLANPVSFYVDSRGRFFVCESFRQNRGVTDNRGHDEAWLNDDLAAQTVADRIAYHRKHLQDEVAEYESQDDRIRLLEDLDGDGQADQSTVFAEHFHSLAEGTGAGVLEHHQPRTSNSRRYMHRCSSMTTRKSADKLLDWRAN